MAKPPGLYRLARALRRAAIVALVLVLVYVGLAGYSLSKFRPSDIGMSSFSSPHRAGQYVTLGGQLNLTNPGFLPINSLSIAAEVALSNGTLLTRAAPAAVTIPAGATAGLPVNISVPLSASGSAASLLTVDQTLEIRLFLNVTYASLFTAQVGANTTQSWGAPFAGLNVTAGSPVARGGTNVSVPLTISFANHASWSDTGTIAIALTQTGAGCPPSSTSIAVDVPPQRGYDQTTQFNTTTGCLSSGQSVALTYTAPGFTLTFPPERIA